MVELHVEDTTLNRGYKLNKNILEKLKCLKLIPWTQPVVTSASSYGLITASSLYSAAYPITAPVDASQTNDWITANGATTGWWKWKMPVLLSFNALTLVVNSTVVSGRPGKVNIWKDSTKTVLLGSYTFPNVQWSQYTFYFPKFTVTDELFIEIASGFSSYAGFWGIFLYADRVVG